MPLAPRRSRPSHARRLVVMTATAAIALSGSVLAPGLVVPASAAGPVTVATYADLAAAVAPACTDGQTVQLTAPISAPTSTLQLACSTELDLNGNYLILQSVVVGAGKTLTLSDTTPDTTPDPVPARLTADATGSAPSTAGIQTSGASLVVQDDVVVAATGGPGSAGIGGSRGADGVAATAASPSPGPTGAAGTDATVTPTTGVATVGGPGTAGGSGGAGGAGAPGGDGGTVSVGETSAVVATGGTGAVGIGGGNGGNGTPGAAGGNGGNGGRGGNGFTSVNLAGASGGRGGDAGNGGAGGPGGNGGTGTALGTTGSASVTVVAGTGTGASGIGGGAAGTGAAGAAAGTPGTGGAAGTGGTLAQVGDPGSPGTAGGAGTSGTVGSFGTVTVTSGTLRVPAGTTVSVPNTAGDEITVGASGVIDGGNVDGSIASPTYGTITGAGQIANAGSIRLPTDPALTAMVSNHNYLVEFDANGGTATPSTGVRVYAASFAAGNRTLPAASLPGYPFSTWSTSRTAALTPANSVVAGTTLATTATQTLYARYTDPSDSTPALAGGLGSCVAPYTVTLTKDLTEAPGTTLVLSCSATIDLDGFDLTVRDIEVGTGLTLTVTDSSTAPATPGMLTADASGTTGQAGIQATGADVVITGRAGVVARGGTGAAGIGGDAGAAGGAVRLGPATDDAVVVTAAGGTVASPGTAVGAGTGSTAFGSLTVKNGTLTIESDLVVPNTSASTDPEVVVDGGTITGGSAVRVTGEGQVRNDGLITLSQDGVASTVGVARRHYRVTFDLKQGTTTDTTDSFVVRADTIARGGRTAAFPTAIPTRTGYSFQGWYVGSTLVGVTTLLTQFGYAPDAGTPLAVPVVARWKVVDATYSVGTLADALSDCDPAAPYTLTKNLTDATAALTVECNATIDLNGFGLSVRNIVVLPGKTLTITDGSLPAASPNGGLLTVVSTVTGVAGISTTGAATFTTTGRARIAVTGATDAAGIGGGTGSDGGIVVLSGGAASVSGGTTAIGAGLNKTGFGSLTITSGTLTVPTGGLIVPDTGVAATDEIQIGASGALEVGSAFTTIGGTGQIRNGGSITAPDAKIAGTVTVTQRNYLVSFTLVKGAPATPIPDVRVRAATFTDAGRADSFPAIPVRDGYTFAGWWSAATGGSQITATSSLVGFGLSATGTPVAVTAHGRWTIADAAGSPDALADALTSCATPGTLLHATGDGTVASPYTVTLVKALSDVTLTLPVNCVAVVDLNGWSVTVKNVVLGENRSLTITDSSTPATAGTFTATSTDAGVAGIATTGAALAITGSAVVVATGAGTAAGIGGSLNKAGGTVTIGRTLVLPGGTGTQIDRPHVTATGGTGGTAIGGTGTASGRFGTLEVISGTLHVPAGVDLVVPDSDPTASAAEVVVRANGRIEPDTTAGTISGAGQISNAGVITVVDVTATVTGLSYLVTFDLAGGTPVVAPVSVYATSFTVGVRSFPADPTRLGYAFVRWVDAAGTTVTSSTTLTSTTTGASRPVALRAIWKVTDASASIDTLRDTLASCPSTTAAHLTGAGTTNSPFKVTLSKDLLDATPVTELVVGCDFELDLAGFDLGVRNIIVQGPRTLTLTGTGGTLTANAAAAAGVAGIRTTGAKLVVRDNVVVTAAGGTGASAIGAASGGTGFGTLLLEGTSTLRLAGPMTVPDGATAGSEVTVAAGARIEATTGLTGVLLGGTGQVDNGGVITLTRAQVDLTVTTHAHDVTFDLDGGTIGTATTVDATTVYADTFTDGERAFPADPVRPGFTFVDWRTGASTVGAGTALTDLGRAFTIRATWQLDDATANPDTLAHTLARCPDAADVAHLSGSGTTYRVTLSHDLTTPLVLTAGCTVTLDLAGFTLDVGSLTITPATTPATKPMGTVTVTSATSGTLKANVAAVDGRPGIRTTGANLDVTGKAVVNATGGKFAAGIGGTRLADGGTVTASGDARIVALGGQQGAGIGAGDRVGSSSVTSTDVHASTSVTTSTGSASITATGGQFAAGIGGGTYGSGGTVHVSGSGTITAQGGSQGAGIGGGYRGAGGVLEASGTSHVVALGGYEGAGIGGGTSGPTQPGTGGTTTVVGRSAVEATGGSYGAGIGGGKLGAGGTTTIDGTSTDGTTTTAGNVVVVATGGDFAAGVGGGSNGAGGVTTTAGTSTLTATGRTDSAGIGGAGVGAGDTTTVGAGTTVTASGGYTAIGSGRPTDARPAFGTLRVTGTLRLPSGALVVPDTRDGPEVTVDTGGAIAGSTATTPTYATITGATATASAVASRGTIANGGRIDLPTTNVTGTGVTGTGVAGTGVAVTGHHYRLDFDSQGGTSVASATVFAEKFDDPAGASPVHPFVAPPDRTGYKFAGWATTATGTANVGASTSLPGLLGAATGPPAAATVYARWTVDEASTSVGTLRDALASCSGTTAAPSVVTLNTPLADTAAVLTVNCVAELRLNSHDLTVGRVVVAPGQSLTVGDGSTAGAASVLKVDAGTTSLPAITTTGATFVTGGRVDVTAAGGAGSAGIGGGPGTDGGTVRLAGSGTVTVTGGSTAIGGGTGATAFGLLDLVSGTFTLPSGSLVVPDTTAASATDPVNPDGAEVLVHAGARITGTTTTTSAGTVATAANVVARTTGTPATTSAGLIENKGVIALPTGNVTGGGVRVSQHHYAVTFDSRGGTPTEGGTTLAGGTVFATTFGAGGRTFPSAPTRPGYVFTGWNTSADGTGTPVTATDDLQTVAGPATGAAATLTLYATYNDPGASFDDLQAGFSTCAGTVAAPYVVRLARDVSAPTRPFVVSCVAELHLDSHDLSVRNVDFEGTRALGLTITDRSPTKGTPGTLTADAGQVDGVAGIDTAGATLVTAGSARIVAVGGAGAAGIGGGRAGGAGTTTISGTSVVTASGGYTAVGSGDPAGGAAAFGRVELTGATAGTGGTLHLPSGDLVLPNTIATGPEITVSSGSLITGAEGGTDHATFKVAVVDGAAQAGSIRNEGVIGLPATAVTGDVVNGVRVQVTHTHFAVTLAAQGGTLADGTAVTTTLFANTFAKTGQELLDPTRTGWRFDGWYTLPESGGTRIDDEHPLSGVATGTPFAVTLYARWTQIVVEVTAPGIRNTSSSVRGLSGARVEDTLVADPVGATKPVGATVTYQWTRTNTGATTNIAGATGPSYTLVPADVGRTIRLRVSAALESHATGWADSAATGEVAKGDLGPAGLVVSGTARVGVLSTATASGSGAGRATTWQWQVVKDGVRSDIPGARGSSYTPAPAYVGQYLNVLVTITATGYADVVEPSPSVEITAADLPALTVEVEGFYTVDASVTGTATLAAGPGNDGTEPAYQWYAVAAKVAGQPDPVPVEIDGADSRTLKLTNDQLNEQVFLRVTASATGFSERVVDTTWTKVEPAPAITIDVTLTDDAVRVGAPVTASPTGLRSATVDGEPMTEAVTGWSWTSTASCTLPTPAPDADPATFIPPVCLRGHGLTVTASVGFPGLPVRAVSLTVEVDFGQFPAARTTISGVAEENEVLTAVVTPPTGTTLPDDTTTSYSWSTGATTPTLRLRRADVGKRVRVTTTLRAEGYDDHEVTSAPTATVRTAYFFGADKDRVARGKKVQLSGRGTARSTRYVVSFAGRTHSGRLTSDRRFSASVTVPRTAACGKTPAVLQMYDIEGRLVLRGQVTVTVTGCGARSARS